jgi:hypothetical protein
MTGISVIGCGIVNHFDPLTDSSVARRVSKGAIKEFRGSVEQFADAQVDQHVLAGEACLRRGPGCRFVGFETPRLTSTLPLGTVGLDQRAPSGHHDLHVRARSF